MISLIAPPQPDPSITLGATADTVVTWICIVTAAACLVVAMWEIAVKRSAVLLFCCLGGVLCNAIEPFWDVLGHLHFNEGNNVAFTMFSQAAYPIDYPVWAVLLYIQFGGFQCWLFYVMLKRGATASSFWAVAGVQVLVNTLIEIPLINANAYQYYGDQPFRVFGFPIWWVFTNFGELLGATVLVFLVKAYGRRAAPAAILIVPASFGAWELWCGWPIYTALNADQGLWLTSVAAVAVAAITVATIYSFTRMLPWLNSLPDRDPSWRADNSRTTDVRSKGMAGV